MEAERKLELLADSLRALDRYEQKQEVPAGEGARPPASGDLYVLEPTRDFNLEWMLVAHDPADPGRFLAVPADGNFLTGSADVELPDDSAAGALRLRCRFATWIGSTVLDPALRVGVVGRGEVERARRKWFEVGDGEVAGPRLAREVDDDPEYRDWVEAVLIPARRTLLAAEEETGDRAEQMVAPPRRPQRSTFDRIAAAITLTVGGGLLGLLLWRLNEP